MESILDSIKKQIGPSVEYDYFDDDLIAGINTTFRILNQIGVGVDGFTIEDNSATWADFLGDELNYLSEVQSYVYMKVRQIFDPPTSSITQQAYKDMLAELEWRMNVEVDPSTTFRDV